MPQDSFDFGPGLLDPNLRLSFPADDENDGVGEAPKYIAVEQAGPPLRVQYSQPLIRIFQVWV